MPVNDVIERTFKDISKEKLTEVDQQLLLDSWYWTKGKTWNDLADARRVLIVSEAGAGKTYECRAQKKRLWDAGEPAFFIELSALVSDDLRNLLYPEEEKRLDAWHSSQSDIATFFLDSIDELKLTRGSFRTALIKLSKAFEGKLHRVRIIITTRPIPFDKQLVQEILPIPKFTPEPDENSLADIVMGSHEEEQGENKKEVQDWYHIALAPLSDKQIVEFAHNQHVDNPDEFLKQLLRCNAQEFARRPQDLIEFCADWREHQCIRRHHEQIETNIKVKLQPRNDRRELAELSVDKAIEGASRLALAMQIMGRLTIRHSAESDDIKDNTALDPSKILTDWNAQEIKALLERPLFGFSSYGRVRFHHRSVIEFLAAKRLLSLRNKGMSLKALKRLIFVETQNKLIVRPSKRPIAGWLALEENYIFELLQNNEPSILLTEGDPETLTRTQRKQALRAFCNRYGPGGWRGLDVPSIQVRRFASDDLADVINKIWQDGVENPDVRETLLEVIGAGHIEACAEIAFSVARDAAAPEVERIKALRALCAVEDKRLGKISKAIAATNKLWPDEIARYAILDLFPKYMSAEQLCQTLEWIECKKESIGPFEYRLPDLIVNADLDLEILKKIRDGLVTLISKDVECQSYQVTSDRSYLAEALAATCNCGIDHNLDQFWLDASIIAVFLYHRDYRSDDQLKLLRARLTDLSSEDNARFFWSVDAWLQSLNEVNDPWERFARIACNIQTPIQLIYDRDIKWVKEALGNQKLSSEKRAILLQAAMRLYPNQDARTEHIEGLKPLVKDTHSFVTTIDNFLKIPNPSKEDIYWKKKYAARQEQKKQEDAKAHQSWVKFWRKVANHPEEAFSAELGQNTAWNLWRAMRISGDDSHSTGWNRRLIEEQFGKKTADKLRETLMTIWRKEMPTLPSERPEDERNVYLTSWKLGMAAIYAEAEDQDWAKNISHEEALIAARHAPLELNSLPIWLGVLGETHPVAIDETLGNELSWELDRVLDAPGHSNLLDAIAHAPEKIAKFFLPRLLSWLDKNGDKVSNKSNVYGMVEGVRKVTNILLKHGDQNIKDRLQEMACQRLKRKLPSELRRQWLQVIMQIDLAIGIEFFENEIAEIEPAERSEAVTLFANFFGERLRDSINLDSQNYAPHLLLRLVRLAYCHVRVEDDAQHEGGYTPDVRDEAERARNYLVGVIFDSKGKEGFDAKIEMAADPLFEHFKYRILAVAEENWAQEIDENIFSYDQAVALDQKYEAPASTNEMMFQIMQDRLSDLDEHLLSDNSPRELWGKITEEKLMRRGIASFLENHANGLYKVDQEAVTGEEKETDIRLRSTISNHEAVIELKIGDRYSGKQLRDTIANQLVKKYMAPDNRKSGALVFSISNDRTWKHPDTKLDIGVEELVTLLQDTAKAVKKNQGSDIAIYIHFLDLRPRLPKENT